jgi:hypothetical protein
MRGLRPRLPHNYCEIAEGTPLEAKVQMFHLLVSYAGWPDTGGSLPSGRVYVDAKNDVDAPFLKNGRLDISKVSRIPPVTATPASIANPDRSGSIDGVAFPLRTFGPLVPFR